MRLDKYLSEQQVGSRSEVHELIKHNRVMIDGDVAKKFGFNVNPEKHQVMVDEKLIQYQAEYCYLLNKPAGIITATSDNKEKTVMDLFSPDDFRKDLFPIGRLDKDTTGMLIITMDGKLGHRLASPKSKTRKTYIATVTGKVSEADLDQLRNGIELKDGTTAVADDVKLLESQTESIIELTLHEGKYHEVKRMFGALGEKVVKLHRQSFAGISDDNLQPGQYRELTTEEIEMLRK
ncbi:pseudouridylate synthase [Paucilactobacillus oligofermentans DSM 15707 = LMG 22743]|uniref:Pseudouridylate synthase n=1 Tax=Paucilactobacillus oligofermentans DSM 15707 = LMG 22743 TaxID=1423778 RepID=A0A0R1RLP5_9LACO|nr:pseudouridine synthase [Paucilactobacillus oligofermentans]KRL56052.1 pseudouridylate synthase [Paucilactobacillus oligofermentans DSM 15707 = LMG 22743]CUS25964.1 Ribosomal small subunit pseudouridine synthase A [Paucilactobacillus oligofermentans DSM 15707 = LMG 22743]